MLPFELRWDYLPHNRWIPCFIYIAFFQLPLFCFSLPSSHSTVLWTHPTCTRISQVRSTDCRSSFSAMICAWLHEMREKTKYSFPGASYATSLLKGERKAPSFLFFPCQYPVISSSFYWRRDTGSLLSRYFWGAHGVGWVLRHVYESMQYCSAFAETCSGSVRCLLGSSGVRHWSFYHRPSSILKFANGTRWCCVQMITPSLQCRILSGKTNVLFLNSLTNSNRLLLCRVSLEAHRNNQLALNDNLCAFSFTIFCVRMLLRCYYWRWGGE